MNSANPGHGPISGQVVGIASDPTNSNIIYIASTGGGVWKTIDGGVTWTPLTDGQVTNFMGCVAVTPSIPKIIYAGTGAPYNTGDDFYGQGILKSTDAGTSWTLLGNSVFFRHTIGRIVVDPTNANTVYAMVAGGGVNGVGGSTGIWKSIDGGGSWTLTTGGIDSNSAYSDLVIDASSPQTLYCAIGVFNGHPNNGVYKTTNGGSSWTKVSGFPSSGTAAGRINIALCAGTPHTLYVSVSDPVTSGILGVYKTTDAAATWSTVTPPFNYLAGTGWANQTIAVSPTDPNSVYVGGWADPTRAILRSTDGGATWTGIATGAAGNNGPQYGHIFAAFDASGRYLDGNGGGIWRLDNATPGSISWNDINGNLQITPIDGVALAPTDFTEAFAGTQGLGTIQQNAGATTWTQRESGAGGIVAVSPNAPTRVYHVPSASPGSPFIRRSDNTGSSWTTKTSGIGATDPVEFSPPFDIDPHSYGGFDRLLTATNRVYESLNNGDSWTALSAPNSAGWSTSKTINAVAASASDFNTIYASANGSTFVTMDHGTSWQSIDIPGGTDHIRQLIVDPTNNHIAYAVRDRFGGGKIFRTANGGTTWTDITANLPDLPTYSIALAPNGPGSADDVLFVGDDAGVYTSSNLGVSWSALGNGLPAVQVHDLALNEQNILAAGTDGRGVWEINIGAAVSNVQASQDGAEIHLWWAANIDPASANQSVMVRRSSDGGSTFTNVGVVPATQTTFVDTNPQAGQTYVYQVEYLNSPGLSPSANSQSITLLPTGDIDHVNGFLNATDITLNGAKILSNGNLQLTDGALSEARAAFTTLGSGPIGNFYSEFDFRLTHPSADGLTFTIQSLSPTAVGNSGSSLGYGGITHSIAVGFNMFSNVTQTYLLRAGSTAATHTNILNNAFHSTDSSGSTDVFHVTLSYDSAARVLTETVIQTSSGNSFSTTYPIDLATTLGDSSAYVGFTGGSGGLGADEQVLNWWWSPTGNRPRVQINGTTGSDSLYLKADPVHHLIDYWLGNSANGQAAGTFSDTSHGFDLHGMGGTDSLIIDESAGDVLLGQSWIDDLGGSINVSIIGSSGNDTLMMSSKGGMLTYSNNGADPATARTLHLANAASLGFSGNGGADTIATAGPTPFTLVLGSTGSENVTVQSGSLTAVLPLNNDALTINNVGGAVVLQIGG